MNSAYSKARGCKEKPGRRQSSGDSSGAVTYSVPSTKHHRRDFISVNFTAGRDVNDFTGAIGLQTIKFLFRVRR